MHFHGTALPPSVASSDLAIDRRRPGRRDASPALIRLLRAPVEGEWRQIAPNDLQDVQDDDLAPARGLALGLILSIFIWAIVVVAAILEF